MLLASTAATVHAAVPSTIDQLHHSTQHCTLCEDLEYNVLYFCNPIHWGLGFIYDFAAQTCSQDAGCGTSYMYSRADTMTGSSSLQLSS